MLANSRCFSIRIWRLSSPRHRQLPISSVTNPPYTAPLSPNEQDSNNSKIVRFFGISCRISTSAKGLSSTQKPNTSVKEPRKYFDQVIITVRSGDGGHGAVLAMPNQRASSKPSRGKHEKEISLVFILQVVADVGLVIPNIYLPFLHGLPNAGKSTLLVATTLARPDIADYPFTTLMPNLGRLDGDPSFGPGMYSSEATFADLPGLIEALILGLGRSVLRHLRRTRPLVHVDAAAENPVNHYRTVKEKLRMYNPDYLERPYIVVFKKIDLPQAKDWLPSLIEEIMRLGTDNTSSGPETNIIDAVQQRSSEGRNADVSSSRVPSKDRKEKDIEDYPRPLAIVGVSVLKGIRVNEMLQAIRAGMRKCRGINEA